MPRRNKYRNKYLAAGVGGALGIGKTIFDNSDDNLLTTTINATVGATLGYASDELIDYIMTKTNFSMDRNVKNVRNEIRYTHTEELSKNIARKSAKTTMADVSKKEVEAIAEGSLEFQAGMKKFNNMLRKAKTVGKIGLGAFALATLLDIGEREKKKIRTKKMVEEEEKNVRRKMREDMFHARIYSFVQNMQQVDMGQLALDMFEDRIGHFKMGNAKFR